MKSLNAEELRNVIGGCNHWWILTKSLNYSPVEYWNWSKFRKEKKTRHLKVYRCRYCNKRREYEYYTYG